MYIIFESGEFKTILQEEHEVSDLLNQLGYKEAPYEIYELGEMNPCNYTEFVPNFYENF